MLRKLSHTIPGPLSGPLIYPLSRWRNLPPIPDGEIEDMQYRKDAAHADVIRQLLLQPPLAQWRPGTTKVPALWRTQSIESWEMPFASDALLVLLDGMSYQASDAGEPGSEPLSLAQDVYYGVPAGTLLTLSPKIATKGPAIVLTIHTE